MTKSVNDTNERLFWTAAAGIIVFVYFFGLSIPLLGPDEPRYAQVAREMFERGDWVTPTLGGFNWFEKPVLLYWLQIVSYNLFGVSEFAARLGSAFFGLGTVAATWLLGRTYGEETGTKFPARVANWFALIMASSLGLIVFARGASFDIILTFPITAAMVSFYVFDSRSRRGATAKSRLPLILFYIFIGVSLLAKGLVGALFPLGIVAFYFLVSRRIPGKHFLTSLVWGAVVSALVASTWYLPMYLKNGWEFIDQFFIQHHFQRYTSNKYLHPQPFHFFFWVLPLMTIPWLPFFFIALLKFGKNAYETIAGPREDAERSDAYTKRSTPLLLFTFAWFFVPLIFFSFSGSKLPGYIMPAVPAAVAFTSVYLLGYMAKKSWGERLVKGLAIATFVVVVAIITFILPRFADTDSVRGLLADAAARGYGSETVLTLHTVSHNAEFYAPGRLLRTDEGWQKRLNSMAEVAAEARKTATGGALLIVPLEHRRLLDESALVSVEIIRDNGEYLLAHVRAK
jgi:4-amino-4-deoxy-L-arabinose transferase-like glycosyltransferase